MRRAHRPMARLLRHPPWIASKPANAPAFTVYEVTAFAFAAAAGASQSAAPRMAGGSAAPDLLADVRGPAWIRSSSASSTPSRRLLAIPTASGGSQLQHVHGIRLRRAGAPRGSPGACRRQGLPRHARVRALAERAGGQVNLFGVLGLVAGIEEGMELNLLGLTFGVDPNDVALELPFVGTFGFGAPVTASTLC